MGNSQPRYYKPDKKVEEDDDDKGKGSFMLSGYFYHTHTHTHTHEDKFFENEPYIFLR